MAELTELPTPHMDWSSTDAPQALKKFKNVCELYFSGPLKDKSEEEQVSYLLIWSGEEGIELVSRWSLTADDKKKRSTYWGKVRRVCGATKQLQTSTLAKFSKAYGFVHVTTSPYFSHANGFIERAVQTVKGLLQKCKESGSDSHLAMLCLRSTPLDHNIPSPAELLNLRVYQTNLPAISKPSLSLSADGDINAKLQTRQEKQKSV